MAVEAQWVREQPQLPMVGLGFMRRSSSDTPSPRSFLIRYRMRYGPSEMACPPEVVAAAITALCQDTSGGGIGKAAIATLMTSLGLAGDYLPLVPPPDSETSGPTWSKIEHAVNIVVDRLPDQPSGHLRSKIQFVERVVRTLIRDSDDFGQRHADFLRALRSNNLDVDENANLVVRAPLPDLQEKRSWLEGALAARGWTTAIEHFQEASRALAGGERAAANAATRSFLTETFDRIHSERHPGCPSSGGVARKHLATLGLIANDYEDKLIAALFAYLGTDGSHPGIPDQATAVYHHQIALATALCFVERHLAQPM